MPFRIRAAITAFCALSFCSACIQSDRKTQEYINAPVNLTVSVVTANTYELRFNSDNREGAFAGYGVFTGASAAAVNAYPATDSVTAAATFCKVGVQANYSTPVAIQVGPAAAGVTAGTALCDQTDLTLTPGSYVALRARVERVEESWSFAAIALVP